MRFLYFQRKAIMHLHIWNQILEERVRQDEEWGAVHDQGHKAWDWVALIVKHLGRAVLDTKCSEVFEEQMVRVAALAVAAIEWNRLNK